MLRSAYSLIATSSSSGSSLPGMTIDMTLVVSTFSTSSSSQCRMRATTSVFMIASTFSGCFFRSSSPFLSMRHEYTPPLESLVSQSAISSSLLSLTSRPK